MSFSLVGEAGLEPARPEWTLEPESSESANSTTRPYDPRIFTRTRFSEAGLSANSATQSLIAQII